MIIMRWYYWLIILLSILLISSLIPNKPSLQDLERFFVYSSSPSLQSPSINSGTIEQFGFEDDQPADINLVVSGLNDCDAIIGTGDGKRDMFDFSDRFITAQFSASNDIPVFPRPLRECR